MESNIHNKLIEALKSHTPEGKNVVDLLTDIIPLSKEAAYRRLRGEIQFTLAEASRISKKLHLSLDTMAGIDKKGFHMFYIKDIFTEKPFEKYYDLCHNTLSVYQEAKKDPDVLFYFAGNALFHSLYFKYKLLSKYSFLKWIYQTSYYDDAVKKLEDIVIPEKVLSIQQELIYESTQVDTCFIIGEDIILSLINDIKYFAAINLVNREEVIELKEEISCMLDDLEKLAKEGMFNSGKKVTVYVSNAYFDANYSHISGKTFESSTIYLFGINQLNCTDPAICEYQKLWVDSLITYSTLISGSGRLEGVFFLDQQREILNLI